MFMHSLSLYFVLSYFLFDLELNTLAVDFSLKEERRKSNTNGQKERTKLNQME